MIIVTGGAGFIGYNLVSKLIEMGYNDIVVIDNDYYNPAGVSFIGVNYMTVEDSYLWLPFNKYNIDVIFHLGARTDTMEKNEDIFNHLNLNYSKFIWHLCSEANITLLYASSAATYGDGKRGFDDEKPNSYIPLNPYGWSKYRFDTFLLFEKDNYDRLEPEHWYGFKFFNVYGNHEEHKGSMASVVLHFYNQIKNTNSINLFKSHNTQYEDGEQERDFIYVEDVVNILILTYLRRNEIPSDIYNLGTGIARTYNDLAKAVFKLLNKKINIKYIDTPIEIRDSYQYHTQAEMSKFRRLIDDYSFISLEKGIELYLKQLENENR